ncbi:MAG TPA: glycosyltransferase [Pyrinomonadaceae bacterium]|nr:glycosyltransferase [Pyrinomonadaceae bacterium]
MKLIVSHLETLRTYVTREFHYLTTDLMRTYGWKHIEIVKLWNGSGTVRDKLIENFGELPETILFCQAYEFLHAHEADIDRLDCHKCFFADDLHWRNEEMRRMKSVSFSLCETLLSTYAYIWAKFYPELAARKEAVWIPHAASPDFMLAYNPNPKNSVLLSGAVNRHYPLRQRLMSLYSEGRYSVTYHPHPGYRWRYNYNANANVGRGYARKINGHRVAFTDSLTFTYLVAKYFEIPAAGALLLADNAVSGPMKKLGFIEWEHYLPVSEDNLEDRVRYVLDKRNHDELDKIRKRGQALILERHKTSDRAKQIDESCSF